MDRLANYRSSDSLRSLQSEVNRLFEGLFPTRGNGGQPAAENAAWSPQMDVLEADDHYRLRMDLPGVERKHVTINAEGQRLIIRGERQHESRQNEEVLRIERTQGRFYRALTLPAEINPDQAQAQFNNGVLTVDLPKVAKNKAKAISIS